MLQIPKTALRTSWFGCFKVEIIVARILCPLLGCTACLEGTPEVPSFRYQETDSAFPFFQGSNALQGPHMLMSLCSRVLAEKRSLLRLGWHPHLLFISKGKTQEGGRLLVSWEIFEKTFEINDNTKEGLHSRLVVWGSQGSAKSRSPQQEGSMVRSLIRESMGMEKKPQKEAPRQGWTLKCNCWRKLRGFSTIIFVFCRWEREGTEEGRGLVKGPTAGTRGRRSGFLPRAPFSISGCPSVYDTSKFLFKLLLQDCEWSCTYCCSYIIHCAYFWNDVFIKSFIRGCQIVPGASLDWRHGAPVRRARGAPETPLLQREKCQTPMRPAEEGSFLSGPARGRSRCCFSSSRPPCRCCFEPWQLLSKPAPNQ